VPGAPGMPTFDAQGVAQVSGSQTLQSGVAISGEVQSTSQQAKAIVADPQGAATTAVTGAATAKANEMVNERVGVDPSTVKGEVDTGVAAYQNPSGTAKAAADAEVQGLEAAQKQKAVDHLTFSETVSVGGEGEGGTSTGGSTGAPGAPGAAPNPNAQGGISGGAKVAPSQGSSETPPTPRTPPA